MHVGSAQYKNSVYANVWIVSVTLVFILFYFVFRFFFLI